MDIFPYYITRTAGMAYETLQQLQSPMLIKVVAEAQAAQAHIDSMRQPVSDLLFDAAKQETDTTQKQAIINTRRNLFNGKIRQQERAVCEALVAQNKQWQPVQEYLSAFHILAKGQQLFEVLYQQSVQAEKKALHHIAAHNSELQAGILLSSHVFFYELQGHLATVTNEERFTDVEMGLWKYISRMATKTSPFSRFATICHRRSLPLMKHP
jgi:hypothetical protein